MAETIQMPKLGFDMAEGTLVNWIKKPGDTINKGDVIAEIETDKATIEIETSVSGVLLKHLATPGDVGPGGADIAGVGQAGESVEDGAAPQPKAQAAPAVAPAESVPAEQAAPTPAQPITPPTPAPRGNGQQPGRVKASPLARKIAADKGLDLAQVVGSGPGGRIVKKDVEGAPPGAAPAAPAAAASVGLPTPSFGALPAGPDVEVIDTSKLRSRIGKRMVEAKQQVPHFYVTSEIDVQALLDLRKQINATLPEESKISVNDLIIKAAALTLRKFPNLNSHFYGDKIVRHKRINIGIAVAMEGGLINVVAKDADKTALGTLAIQNKEMIQRARDGKVRPDDVEGSTFTVSNLGPFDVDTFVAIINPPEAAILAIGTAKPVPVVKPDGTLGTGMRLKITISADHRVTDGAEAAQFMQEMKRLIENPLSLLI